MYGFLGFFDSPSPCVMIFVSWATVRNFPIGLSAGTSGDTPPRPCSPWQAAQANWTKSWPPAATCGSIAAERSPLSGAVDAAIVLPPSNFQLQAAGYNDLGLTVEYAPELPFSGTAVSKAWATRNQDVLRRVLAVQAKSIEYFYDERNRADLIRILVAVSSQKPEDVEKSYDFFRKNNFFDRTGKISRRQINALLDALVGLGDLPARGNVERFLLPGVAQLSD